MINKNTTITIDANTPSTGTVKQKTIDSIKELSNDPKWIEALKRMNEQPQGRTKQKGRAGK